MMKQYACLIMDIENSKKYDVSERNEIQQYMNQCINNLNGLFREDIQFEVTFSAGDELQGLFDNVVTALLYFRLFEILIAPVKIRAGVGVGDWTVKMESGLSTQQDGPAYHHAREAIDKVHGMQLQNIRICSDDMDDLVNYLLNASLPLKRQQIYMQNMVQALIELLFPFVAANENAEKYVYIKELVGLKFEYRIGSKKSELYTKRNLDKLPNALPIEINGEIGDAESMIIKKNTATIISQILQCSRQNVDTIMRRGNSNKIRELDYVALQYVRKTFGVK